MISDLNMLCFHEYNVVFDLIYELYTLAIVRNPRPQKVTGWDIGGDGL